MLSKRIHVCELFRTCTEIEIKNTIKYNLLQVFLEKMIYHVFGNLSACFQILDLFVRNQTACFEKVVFISQVLTVSKSTSLGYVQNMKENIILTYTQISRTLSQAEVDMSQAYK